MIEFISKIAIKGPNECWLWQKGKASKRYGSFKKWGRKWNAHRFSWSYFNGPIPLGMFVCHSCDIPLCVNPNHLWLGTAYDNVQDAVSKGRK